MLPLLTLLALGVAAQDAPSAKLPPEHVEFFEKKIRPVLVDRCYRCHSIQSGKSKGGLYVDTREGLLKGGDTGPAIVPGHPEKSVLIKAVRHEVDGLQMPDKEKLAEEHINDLIAWVKIGAPDPRISTAPAAATSPAMNFAAARTFWSFRPIDKIDPPGTSGHPIDRFLLAKLGGLGFSPEADRRTLLRRASFDLTGLPPSDDDLLAFLTDAAPNAWERAVDRLLASPRYGERWGRHWLDVARYADTKEWVVDEERRLPYPFTYRDWVIDAFNGDLPFDRFVTLQLAADRVPAEPRDLAALGFLTVGRSFLNRLPDIIDDRIDVLGRGLLGLSIGCARCHDHKYDPVPTKDYYSLYGIFASSAAPKELPLLGAPKLSPEYATWLVEWGKRQKAIDDFRAERHAAVTKEFKTPESVVECLLATASDLDNPKINRNLMKRWRDWVATKPAALADWRAYLAGAPTAGSLEEAARLAGYALAGSPDPAFPPNIPLADFNGFLTGDDNGKLRKLRRTLEESAFLPGAPPRAMSLEESPTPHAPRVFIRGNPGSVGEEVPRKFLSLFSDETYKGGGRLELAKAVVDSPLAARVWVNRVWARHFGRGIVPTPSDFGVRGEPPSHPELLDWLATRFVAEGGSTKKLHRLMLSSAAWRQTSADRDDGRRKDPQNILLWRMNRTRLDLEAMRDSLLAAAGTLDLAMGGRAVEISAAPFPPRRTVYGYVDRLNLANLYKTFDFATPDMHAPKRHETTIPQQALFLMNNPFVMEQAAALAVAAPDVRRVYRRLYQREPTDREIRLADDFVRASAPRKAPPPAWQYGVGPDFKPLPHFAGQAWQGGKKLPDPAFGWALLNATGGHAEAGGVIRRWTSPAAGTVSIAGTLSHASKDGDGVRGRIVTKAGEVATWVVARMTAETRLSGLKVEEGDTIDFIVDNRTDTNSDGFSWAPVVTLGEETWNAATGFGGPAPAPAAPLSAWERYVHVLLQSNEFLFVD
ncbi:MAG TPA: PSD1 and planctomycete cytochrome C domain-containing protein [Planctomycetota bacterium]